MILRKCFGNFAMVYIREFKDNLFRGKYGNGTGRGHFKFLFEKTFKRRRSNFRTNQAS